jgi:glycerate kinase
MRVLIAPDCYGDSLTAVEAAQSIADGWRRGRPDDQLTLAPQSDGGPGFVGVLAGRLGEVRTLRVSGPLTAEVSAEWVLDPAAPRTAYIECAQACGLALLGGPPTVQTALAAHSRGVGQLIAAAVRAGAERIVARRQRMHRRRSRHGRGAGYGREEHNKRPPGRGPRAARGCRAHRGHRRRAPALGPMGAATVFGPQKGADPDTVRVLEQRLTDWAAALNAAAGQAVGDEPGAGAAGGIGAALLALGGRRESGAAVIAEHTRLADDVAAAQLVITGEGRFDDQSLRGKVVSALAAGARARRIPVVVLAGQITLDEATMREAGIAAVFSITDHAGSVQLAVEDAANQLEGLAEVTAATWG